MQPTEICSIYDQNGFEPQRIKNKSLSKKTCFINLHLPQGNVPKRAQLS